MDKKTLERLKLYDQTLERRICDLEESSKFDSLVGGIAMMGEANELRRAKNKLYEFFPELKRFYKFHEVKK